MEESEGAAMNESAKRRDRPIKPAEASKRLSLGLKVTPQIKERLERAAEESGRTQSQEAEVRLELSFNREDLLGEAMSLAYGRELAGLLMMLGTTMHDVGRSAGFSATFTIEGANAWWSHPYAYDQVVQAVVRLLEAARPVGERRPPKGPDAEARALRIKYGTDFANSMIDVVCGRVATERDGTEGDKLRRLLGPVIVKRLTRLV
jgi:TraY domain